ncbi:shufflon protein [Paraburkholderia silvatlantica]|uniref:Shufflon protein n=1 Tax=Paraburkholderia silvatlantica TaxID=321895 RepID=A0A2V4UER9_9BURK|nr:shufflon system plasmid conjugative transfer pilus tip adhesin PilV [Paraburkholderia silvatlantica]PYE22857.1 shufflon protein [Paraburkholderia silvatlantica]
MDEILGAFFALLVGMMYLPKIENGIATARQTQTDVTTAQQQQQQWASAVGSYVSQNMATFEASATASTPVTLSVATVQAANVGLPSNFSSTNPFNQTWTAQVLQPTAGTLQVLAYSSGGNAIKDQELGQIARAAGGSGGFIPTNNSGAYAGGPATAYGTFGGWKISTTGYSVGSGGAPATLLTFTNGALSSNYLYRNAVPGQPQLNEMNTALGMNSNNITNVGQLQANAGNGVQIGNSYYYGDGSNSAIRQNGALYVQNQAGTAAAPINSGTVNVSGDVNASGNVNADGSFTAGGAVQGSYLHSTGNAQVDGSLNANGNVSAGGYLIVQGAASPGGSCPGPQYIGQGANGPLLCESGVWADSSAPSGTICGGVNVSGTTGQPEGGGTSYIPCQGLAFLTQGCPAGYTLASTYAADTNWFFACYKN